MVVALAALVLAAGGFAVAAIPQEDGTIHSCYKKKGGKLRVVKGAGGCKDDERGLNWNQGVAGVTVRTKVVTVPVTCSESTPGFYICSGSKTDTVQCARGERATGGGYGVSQNTTATGAQESKPSPTAGKPTGWTVNLSAFHSTQGFDPTPAKTPIYAVCAD
jgi:hypothetical protein